MAQQCVPRERIAAIIERVLPEYGGDTYDRTREQCGRLEAMASTISDASGMSKASVHRRLYSIRNGGSVSRGYKCPGNPTFATADLILSGLGLTHLWHTELSDLYEAA